MATKRLVLSVMFIDIRGSSRIAQFLSPEGTVEFLDRYLGLAAQAILANRGEVNQFIGDGILATFGLHGEPDHGASNALAAAAEIHQAFESEAGKVRFAENAQAVVAIHTGTVILHPGGREEYMAHGVLGAAVNVAARLEWECKELGLSTVLSGAAVAALRKDAGGLRLVTRKKLRGLSDRVEIWSPDPTHQPSEPDAMRSTASPSLAPAAASPTAHVHEVGWKAGAAVCAFGAAFVSMFAALVVLRPGGLTFIDTFTRLAYLGLGCVAATACILTARRSRAKLSVAWTLIAASVMTWAVAQGTLGNEFGQEANLLVLPIDFAFLIAFSCALSGVFFFWTLPLAPSDQPRALLDGLVVLVCLLGSTWVFGLRDVYISGSSDLERATQVTIPVGWALIATVLILVINRGGRLQSGPLLILLLSATINMLASVFGGEDASDVFWTLANGGQLIALLLIALAAVWPTNPRPFAVDVDVDVWHLALPWMAVGLAAVSTFTVFLEGKEFDRFLTLLAGTLAGLLALSQAYAHRDTLLLLARSRRSEKTLADMVAKAPLGIARVNTDLIVVAANPSLGVLLREPPDAIVGSAIVKYLVPEMQTQMRDSLRTLATGEADVVEIESPIFGADGTQMWVHLTATPVTKPTRQLDYFLAMMQDITARHEAEQVSGASAFELERLNKVKTEFLQSISHEFKTALIGINGFSELIRDADVIDPDEVKQFATDIHSEAERLNRMIAEFLDVDRIETSRPQVRLASVDMNVIIRREVEFTKRGTDGLTFREMLDPNLATMVGDSDKLADLVRLLLSDAVKHSPDGGEVAVVSRNHLGQVEMTVRDQGLGVRAEFDKPLFSETDLYANSPIRRVVGIDLGLGIARKIVAFHGGNIWMDRLDGIGSETHVSLPLNLAVGPAASSRPDLRARVDEAAMT